MRKLLFAAPLVFIFVVGFPRISHALGIGGIAIGAGPSVSGVSGTAGVSGEVSPDAGSMPGQAVHDAKSSGANRIANPAVIMAARGANHDSILATVRARALAAFRPVLARA